MLQTVDVGERSLSSYDGVVPAAILSQLREVARDLRGVRMAHINATPYGGGVSELLRSTVPLYNDLGLLADWKIISGDNAFFEVTKKIHNGLQGAELSLRSEEQEHYQATAKANAAALTEEYDVVFVHDPQPAAILPFHGRREARWVWRCHIDTGQPNAAIWSFCRQFLADYDAAIFTMDEFVPPDFPVGRVDIVPPAIDPLSPKNLPLADSTIRQVLDWIGISLSRPLITQVSRFDPWKDPLGVIAAYKLAKEDVPNLQLALVGSMALDDPEGWEVYRKVQEASAVDPMIHVFTNLTGVGNIEVNAFQRLSDVVVQKSIREGFGLVVSESLWKETPVVAGRAGGIPLQMSDGVGGFLVDGVEECAEAILRLLKDPDLARRLGQKGQQRVREHFLLPRLLLNELSLTRDLLEGRSRLPTSLDGHRDPVCGMAISEKASAVHLAHAGLDFYFCSEGCKARFLAGPERYLAAGQRG
ncbi:MAG TPA: glycosyltransferase [Dehalococcoidia bacterium]|nr:glycosyltransferase [Dehalococcoidia bacterium]